MVVHSNSPSLFVCFHPRFFWTFVAGHRRELGSRVGLREPPEPPLGRDRHARDKGGILALRGGWD